MTTQPPRVLLLITQSDLGGAQRYVLMLAEALQHHGYHPVVGCGEGGELIDALDQRGVERRIFPALVREIRPGRDLRALFELVAYMRAERFALVHCNSTKAGFIGRIAARIARVPAVFYTVHGCVLNEPMSRLNFLLYWFLEWSAGLLTTQFIAVSQRDRATLRRYHLAPDRKIAVIPNGIDPGPPPWATRARQRAEAREMLGLPPDAIVIGTIANFYQTKALDVLLHATALVADEQPALRLVIVGDGPERPLVERLISELSLHERVTLTGQVVDGRQLLPGFDQFVLASRKEGMPLALLEAMAAGLPVIVTSVGGMPEVVNYGHAGLIIPPEDPEELAAAILDLIASPDLAETLGREARERVESTFTEQRMTDQTIALYPIHPPDPGGARVDQSGLSASGPLSPPSGEGGSAYGLRPAMA